MDMSGWTVQVALPGEDDVMVSFDADERPAVEEFVDETIRNNPGATLLVLEGCKRVPAAAADFMNPVQMAALKAAIERGLPRPHRIEATPSGGVLIRWIWQSGEVRVIVGQDGLIGSKVKISNQVGSLDAVAPLIAFNVRLQGYFQMERPPE